MITLKRNDISVAMDAYPGTRTFPSNELTSIKKPKAEVKVAEIKPIKVIDLIGLTEKPSIMSIKALNFLINVHFDLP
jgi:hypothetical protein